ncbi:MAG: hypothetical protein FWC34_01995 [Bacteroidetes bacterium]|nr:hypothetical protein [Bacteroidota bacterium]MCL2303082.1 hypothetical protein [Lentimicrobiaceae bacterium]
MKKLALLLLSFVLLLACNKEEKFPTKNDLKGHWVKQNESYLLTEELIFDNKSVQLIHRSGYSETCNYRLSSTSKQLRLTCKYEERTYEIWINKNTGLLYLDEINRFTFDVPGIAIYKKIE